MFAIFRAVPLLIFPALLYAAVAMTMQHDAIRASLDQVFVQFNLPSGALFTVTRGYALTFLAAGCLFLEIVKATEATRASLVENGLAFVVFSLALMLFLLQPAFGTVEWALMMAMMLTDFMASFIVMVISARRDVQFSGG